MERFVSGRDRLVEAASADLSRTEEASQSRSALTGADIKTITDMARSTTAAQAARRWNTTNQEKQVGERAVQRWKKHWDTTRTYYVPEKRGPKELLLEDEKRVLGATFDSIRKTGTPVSSFLFARVARGIVRRSRPAISEQDRVAIFCLTWARDEMKRMGINVRKGTTDRTVSAAQISTDGEDFYTKLAFCGVQHKELLFNMDEFFIKLENGGQQWTWERVKRGEKKNIAITAEKLGFTCSVLSSGDGQIHLLQLIWKGKTDAVHAVPSDSAHPKIYQTHNATTHFQTESTFAVWLERFVEIVRKVRSDKGLRDNEKAVLVLDAAVQHVTRDSGLNVENIDVIDIPKKQTHCFQPADQFIISGLKKKATKAWGNHVEEMFAAAEAGDATVQMLDRRMKLRRDRKYKYLAEALDTISNEVVEKSWVASGILRATFREPAPEKTRIQYDAYREMAVLEGNTQVAVDSTDPSHSEEETLPGPTPEASREDAHPPTHRDVQHQHNPQFVLVKGQGRPKKLVPTRDEIIKNHHRAVATKRNREPKGITAFFAKKRKLEDID